MPRPNTVTADVVDFLRGKSDGATMEQIVEGLWARRGETTPRHTIRSAVYQNLDDKGARLFRRLTTRRNGPYGLQ